MPAATQAEQEQLIQLCVVGPRQTSGESDPELPPSGYDADALTDGDLPERLWRRFLQQNTRLLTNGLRYVAGSTSNSLAAPAQSSLLVMRTSLDLHTVRGSGVVLTPAKAGPVRIMTVNGGSLTFTSRSGATLVFDVDSGTFVSL